MTEEQAKRLKAGDVAREIRTGKEIVIEKFELNKFNGEAMIYLMKPGDDPNYSFALPYYLYELELVNTDKAGLCTCDIMFLMRIGCKCNGR